MAGWQEKEREVFNCKVWINNRQNLLHPPLFPVFCVRMPSGLKVCLDYRCYTVKNPDYVPPEWDTSLPSKCVCVRVNAAQWGPGYLFHRQSEDILAGRGAVWLQLDFRVGARHLIEKTKQSTPLSSLSSYVFLAFFRDLSAFLGTRLLHNTTHKRLAISEETEQLELESRRRRERLLLLLCCPF